MHSDLFTKLDNPVWHSLSESHRQLAIDYTAMKFYQPAYCLFGGFEEPVTEYRYSAQYEKLTSNFFIIGEKPLLPDALMIKKELVCLQMVLHNKIDLPVSNNMVLLTDAHTDALYTLVNLVQPGYFTRKTALLGSYFGIFIKDELVAVTGERMKMHAFTEISAVVTHPAHTGKGYARQLLAHTANNIFSENKTPYLHVLEDNVGAIRLYETLGFTTRRKISFWHITAGA